MTTLLTDGANGIDLPDIGVNIPLADLYTGLALEDGAAGPQ